MMLLKAAKEFPARCWQLPGLALNNLEPHEDFRQPILVMYNFIGQHSNISLIAGSGFGAVEDIWPYLTGDWAVQGYGVQPMPFDGFLFTSRVMVAKEIHTSSTFH
ncbi:hypothetical protein PILCRDRAFT_15217 [Piloderma croceum F 1598]|uniref:Fatty acid synthase beta subunit AflB /Fas1-like central domain-containing protein n=1 Tax=Piloderma croceum (strain F 1598) TaxID=765440 RepID=A0A0C3EZY3_PILCF|nr:hypothetical protein PILCRDRAFT_15217 [Piloderma croceum F 1598]